MRDLPFFPLLYALDRPARHRIRPRELPQLEDLEVEDPSMAQLRLHWQRDCSELVLLLQEAIDQAC